MGLEKETTAAILGTLRFRSQGLTITEIARKIGMNRNSVAKYLQILMVSGQVEKQTVGNAKVYSLSQRKPLSSILSCTSDFIVVINSQRQVIDLNDPYLTVFGLQKQDVLLQDVRNEMLPLLSSVGIAEFVENGLEGQESSTVLTYEAETDTHHYHCKFIPTVLDSGERGLTIFIEDITQREQTVEALRVSEEKFRQITERSFDIIFLTDAEGVVTFISPSIERITGLTPAEVIGRHYQEFIYEEDLPTIEGISARIKEGETIGGITLRIIRSDGSIALTEANLSPVIEGVQGVLRDLSEREAAWKAQALLASIVESSSDAIIGKSLDRTIISWNDGAEQLYGFTAEEVIGKPISIIVPPDCLHEVDKNHDHLMGGGHIIHAESSHIRKDGTRIDVAITVSPIYDADGTVLGGSTIVRDITEKKRAERALRKSEETARALLDATIDSAILLDPDNRIVAINNHAVGCLRKHGVEVKIGDHIADLFPPDVARGREEMCAEAIRTGKPVELEDELNGRRYFTRFNPVLDANGKVIALAAFNRDITKMRQAEEELRHSEKTAKMLLDASNDVALLLDTDGHILIVNQHAFEAFARYGGGAVTTESDVIGKRFHELVPAELSVIRERKGREVIATGEPVHHTEEYGGRVLKNTMTPIISAAGRVEKIAIFSRDITEKRMMKRELSEKHQQMHDIIEFLPDATFVVNTEGTIIAWNRAMETLSGVKKVDMLGKGNYGYAVPFYGEQRPALVDLVCEPEEVIRSFYRNAKISGHSVSAYIHCHELKGGRGAYLLVNASPLYNSDGEMAGGIESVRDISPQMVMEKQIIIQRDLGIDLVSVTSIQESIEITLSTAMSAAEMEAGGIQIIDPDTNELVLLRGENISDEFRRFVERMPAKSRYTLHVLTGSSTFYPSQGRYPSEMQLALEREGFRSVATVPITYHGTVIGALHVASRKRDSIPSSTQKTLESIAILAGNTIGRIRSERAIRKSEERLSIAIRGAGIGVWEHDIRSGRISLDEYLQNLYGYLPQDRIEDAKNWLEIVQPQDRDGFLRCYHECIDGDSTSFEAELRVRRKDGEWIWTRSFGMVTERDADGSPLCFTGMTQNINPMKALEDAFGNSERFMGTLINSIPDMVYFKDEYGRLAVVNSACTQLLGQGEQELIGKCNRDLLPEGLAAQCDRSDHAVFSSGKMERCQERMVHGNGQPFILDTIKVPVFNDEGSLRGLLGVSRDITSILKMEGHIEQIEKKFRHIFMNAHDAILRYEITENGLPGRIVEVNPAASRMLGYAPEELMMMTAEEIVSPVVSEYDWQALVRRLAHEGHIVFEAILERGDGGEVPVEMRASLIEIGGDKTIFSMIRDTSVDQKKRERLRRMSSNLDFLSRTGAECVRFPPERDIIGYIAEELHSLLPDAVIACASRHNGSSRFIIRAVEGSGGNEALLVSLLGEHPLGMVLSPDDALPDLLKAGELIEVSGDLVRLCGPEFADRLYPALTGALQQGICSAIGIAGDHLLFGIVFIFDQKGGMSEEASIIEMFVGQAVSVLQKRHVANLIRTSFEDLEGRVQERTQDLIRANEVLSMEIIGQKYAMKDSQFQRALAAECFNRLEGAAFGVDEEGRIQIANQKACKLLGYTCGELRGRVWIDEVVAPVSQREALSISMGLSSGNPVNSSSFRGSLLTRDGDECTQHWHARVLVDERGLYGGLLWTGEGIPEEWPSPGS
jgi:PAS domain S-box-containing protein